MIHALKTAMRPQPAKFTLGETARTDYPVVLLKQINAKKKQKEEGGNLQTKRDM